MAARKPSPTNKAVYPRISVEDVDQVRRSLSSSPEGRQDGKGSESHELCDIVRQPSEANLNEDRIRALYDKKMKELESPPKSPTPSQDGATVPQDPATVPSPPGYAPTKVPFLFGSGETESLTKENELPSSTPPRLNSLKQEDRDKGEDSESDQSIVRREAEDEVNPLKAPVKKSVSYVPQPPKLVNSLLQKARRPSGGMEPSPRLRQTTVNSDYDYTENTPLLYASSLPTVVGEEIPGSSSYNNPNYDGGHVPISTRSEGGRREGKKRKRKNRLRRRVNSDPSIFLAQAKKRPFIASPFIPIATQVAIEPDRRSVVSYSGREPSGTYGTLRRDEERKQKKAPEPEESSSEEDEDEEESASESAPESMRKASFSSLTSREWATIVMLALANLCSTVAFSCIAPFYPSEATLKGMNESQTGIVFGIFELVMFIVAPIFGKHMIRIGSKNMFTFGLGLTGVTAIFFGFLNYLPSGPLFFWASLLVRCLEAVGDAAFVTSSFAISARCFPGRISVVVGVMETFAGLGFTAGPLIGGFLYEHGGFQMPFLVLGTILLVATILSCCLIDAHEDDPVDENAKGMLGMLRIPHIWMMVFAIIVCSVSLSFLDPTLEAHLRSFNLTPTLVGLMFLLCGGIYTLSAPCWGLLIDRFHCTDLLMLFGSVATILALFIIGPAPFMPFEKDLVVIGIALAILGVAAGALYIPTFQGCLDVVKLHGYEDTFQTYGCVSGVFQSAFAFGGFIGPTLGGAAVQSLGFEWTTTILGFILCLFVVVFFIFHGCLCCLGCKGSADRSSSSHTPLTASDEAGPSTIA